MKPLMSYIYRTAARMGLVNVDEKLVGAALMGDTSTVRSLLAAGADVNAKDNNAGLLVAAFNGHAEIVRLLLEAGADVHAEKDAALRAATEQGHGDTVKVLQNWISREVRTVTPGI